MYRSFIGLAAAAILVSACSGEDPSTASTDTPENTVSIAPAPETVEANAPAAPAPKPVKRSTIDVPTAPVADIPVRLDQARLLTVRTRGGDDAKAFEVLRTGNTLIYRKAACGPEHRDIRFALHIIPQNPADLPEGRSFVRADFAPEAYYLDGDTCYTLRELPAIAATELRTGQWERTEGTRWNVRLDP